MLCTQILSMVIQEGADSPKVLGRTTLFLGTGLLAAEMLYGEGIITKKFTNKTFNDFTVC